PYTDRMTPPDAAVPPGDETVRGQLVAFVAFDWGDEVDLDRARRLAPAAARPLARRPRTPSSFAYRPAPLRFGLGPAALPLPHLGDVPAAGAEATVFDFGAVSVGLRVPLDVTPACLAEVAGCLADPDTAAGVVRAARAAVTPLHAR